MAAPANRPANTVSAIGRVPDVGRLSRLRVENGTATMVSAANGRSRQRASNIEPSAVCPAITVVTIRTKPKRMVEKEYVLLWRGPISSRKVGKPRPDIKALAQSTGAAAAAASSEPHNSQPPNPKLS